MWKKITIVLVVAIIGLGVIFSDAIISKYDSAKTRFLTLFHKAIDEKLYEGFRKTADEFNKRGPVMVSKNLRLDKTEAGPGARITYFYTFVNNTANDIKSSLKKSNLETKLADMLCKNDKVKPTLDLGADYIYVYNGSDGMEIMRVDINKSGCAKE